ncbi:MAG: DNA polymerase sliding clamp [Metallosphaera sp.]|uniref:DNA polymerase sliding clamp n=1 Tax=Metallosphaera sp. TaxID=2020860 RepID=UPI0031658DFA
MMFRAIYSSSKDFYYIISSMSKITDNLPINLTEEGISSKYLTEDKVMMGVVDISKNSLEEYQIEKPMSIELNLNDLKKILSKMKGRSSIEIYEIEDGIRITVRDEKTGTRSNLSLKVEKKEVQSLKEPSVNHSVTAKIDGEIFKAIISEASKIGDEIEIVAENDSIVLKVQETGKGYIATLREGKPLSELMIESLTNVRYGTPVLEKVVNALSFSSEIEFSLGSGVPMKIIAPLEKGASLKFWVAPRL